MLAPRLKAIKDALEAKDFTSRSTAEDQLLEELDEVDKIEPQNLTENYRSKAAGYPVMGPIPGSCPTCGRSW